MQWGDAIRSSTSASGCPSEDWGERERERERERFISCHVTKSIWIVISQL